MEIKIKNEDAAFIMQTILELNGYKVSRPDPRLVSISMDNIFKLKIESVQNIEPFGDRLGGLRRVHFTSQTELAKASGLSCPAISNYESGERKPDYDSLIKLARAFSMSVSQLIGENLIKTEPSFKRAYSDVMECMAVAWERYNKKQEG